MFFWGFSSSDVQNSVAVSSISQGSKSRSYGLDPSYVNTMITQLCPFKAQALASKSLQEQNQAVLV